MTRAKDSINGRLEEALVNLIQIQAIFAQNQAMYLAQKAETDRQIAEMQRLNSERFARIEAILIEHSRILAEHTRILQALPDAIRDKIGFKIPESRQPAE